MIYYAKIYSKQYINLCTLNTSIGRSKSTSRQPTKQSGNSINYKCTKHLSLRQTHSSSLVKVLGNYNPKLQVRKPVLSYHMKYTTTIMYQSRLKTISTKYRTKLSHEYTTTIMYLADPQRMSTQLLSCIQPTLSVKAHTNVPATQSQHARY